MLCITIIVVRNRINDPSSNPGYVCFLLQANANAKDMYSYLLKSIKDRQRPIALIRQLANEMKHWIQTRFNLLKKKMTTGYILPVAEGLVKAYFIFSYTSDVWPYSAEINIWSKWELNREKYKDH